MVTQKNGVVVVVGASPKPERYSYKACVMLADHGYEFVPLAPAHEEIYGKSVVRTLEEISESIDTVTLYVGPAHQETIISQIVAMKPRRVLFNPGTENPVAYHELDRAGIAYHEACTLVLLSTGQF